jgi:hypothetical protein
VRGEHQDLEARLRLARAFEQGHPVHLRHLQIRDQKIEAVSRQLVQRGLAVLASHDVVPGYGERVRQEFADPFFVVDDQDSGQLKPPSESRS